MRHARCVVFWAAVSEGCGDSRHLRVTHPRLVCVSKTVIFRLFLPKKRALRRSSGHSTCTTSGPSPCCGGTTSAASTRPTASRTRSSFAGRKTWPPKTSRTCASGWVTETLPAKTGPGRRDEWFGCPMAAEYIIRGLVEKEDRTSLLVSVAIDRSSLSRPLSHFVVYSRAMRARTRRRRPRKTDVSNHSRGFLTT